VSYGSTKQRQFFYSLPQLLKNVVASSYGWKERRRRQGSFYHDYFVALTESQWWSDERLREQQFARLKAFLIHSGRESPFYRRRFKDAGFDPSAMTEASELSQLPILSKEDARENVDHIVCRDRIDATCRWVNTSGTTGAGFRFLETGECYEREYAYRFQNYACGGVSVGDRWAFCAGHPVVPPDQKAPPFWIHDYCNNWLLMSSLHLSEEHLVHFVGHLKQFTPVLLGGYPSSIYVLALANSQLGNRVKPTAIYTASETLVDYQREVIQASFGCQPRSYYGNAERCGFIAECSEGTFHARLEHSYVEIIRNDGSPAQPGETGKIVCTGFGNWVTPLIRYDVGDLATVSRKASCECGRGGILLETIVGRIEDYIVTPEGRFAGRLDHLFKDAVHVRMAQLYQDSVDAVHIRIVRTPDYTALDEDAILREARLRLGNAIAIEFEYVPEITRSPSGKFRFVVSKIAKKELFGQTVPSTCQ
jgi:phenylacetate-CoA ligase